VQLFDQLELLGSFLVGASHKDLKLGRHNCVSTFQINDSFAAKNLDKHRLLSLITLRNWCRHAFYKACKVKACRHFLESLGYPGEVQDETEILSLHRVNVLILHNHENNLKGHFNLLLVLALLCSEKGLPQECCAVFLGQGLVAAELANRKKAGMSHLW